MAESYFSGLSPLRDFCPRTGRWGLCGSFSMFSNVRWNASSLAFSSWSGLSVMSPPNEGFYSNLTYRTASPFTGAWLKVKRAKQHLSELALATKDITARQALYVIVDGDPEAGEAKFHVSAQRPMPQEYSATVGDVIHNLRSALDHLAVVLSQPPIGRGNGKNVYFPTGKTREEFVGAIHGHTRMDRCGKKVRVQSKMKGAPADALRVIEELEPYDGGKHSLRALHDLDIVDKHKLIVPAVSFASIHKMSVTIQGRQYTLTGADFHADWARISHPGITATEDIHFTHNSEATFEIVFDRDQPLAGEPIMPTLLQLANLIEGVIKQCEALFLTTNAPG